MRLFLTIILGVMFFPGLSLAQEDNFTTATSALQNVLSSLKQSVEKLGLDNDQLTAKDNAVKAQVLQLQLQLGQIEAQGEVLNKAADRLQEKNPRRSQQITRLEEENFDLDNRIQKAEVVIKSIQKSLDAGYQEDQRLLLQLKNMQNGLPGAVDVPSMESQAAAHRQVEKLKLMKMIYDSQQRQESLHESILEFQKNTPLLPAAGALAHQQQLKEQIKDLGSQIAAYPPETASSGNPGPANQWDDAQLRQLELELTVLEKNYSQLKDLMGQMTKKAQDAQMTVNQKVEGGKLQSNIEDLNRQGEGLMADLDDLRSQMVDLDKRKSRLETMIRQMP